MPNFKSYDQNQSMLLPPFLADCLPSDHFAFVVNAAVESLDLEEIIKTYSSEGSPAYNPRLMIKILFYGYAEGVVASRKIERATYENNAFRYLAANAQPDHGTINLFRKAHLSRLGDIFAQIVLLCDRLDMVDLSDISIDGTKIKASASTKNLFDQERIDKLRERINRSLEEAVKLDEEEDKLYGDKKGYRQIPEALIDPQERTRIIKETLEKIKLEKLAEAEKKIKGKQAKAKTKEEKGQKKNRTSNTTDPDANLMKMKDGSYRMGYNIQLSSSRQIITGYAVNSELSDAGQLQPMIRETESTTGQKVKTVKADSAYFSKNELEFCQENAIDAYIPDTMKSVEEKQERDSTIPEYDRRKFRYDPEHDQFICPQGQPLVFSNLDKVKGRKYIGANCGDCPVKAQCTQGKRRHLCYDPKMEKMRTEMRDKLNAPEGKAKYLERLSEIEPVYGDLKQNRGFTKFHTRGKPMVLIETGLYSIAHNLVKIFNHLKKQERNGNSKQLNLLMRLQAAS